MSFVVIKRGVYAQNVFGPFSTLLPALIRAQQLAAQDYDDYHDYDVESVAETGLGEDTFCSYRKNGERAEREARQEQKQRSHATARTSAAGSGTAMQ